MYSYSFYNDEPTIKKLEDSIRISLDKFDGKGIEDLIEGALISSDYSKPIDLSIKKLLK